MFESGLPGSLYSVVLLILPAAGLLVLYLVLRRVGRDFAEPPGDSSRSSPIWWRAAIVGAVAALLVYGLFSVAAAIPSGILLGTYRGERGNLEDPTLLILPSIVLSSVVSALVGFVAMLVGGYLAGRWTGHRGGAHGLLVAGIFLLLKWFSTRAFGMAFLLISPMIGWPDTVQPDTASSSTTNTGSPPVDFQVIMTVALLAPLVSWLLAFLGGYLGGKLGERRVASRRPG